MDYYPRSMSQIETCQRLERWKEAKVQISVQNKTFFWMGHLPKQIVERFINRLLLNYKKTSDFTSLVATISIQWVPLILLKWPCFGSTEWWDQNFDRNRDFFSKTKFSETETFFLRPNFLKPKPDTGLNRNQSDILQTMEQQTNKWKLKKKI